MTLTLTVTDPCDGDTTITFDTTPSWNFTPYTTDDNSYTVNTADIVSTTSPAGADCGAYSVIFTLTDADGNPPPSTATISVTAYSYNINFNQDVDATGDWTLNVVIYHTDYPNYGDNGSNAFVSKNYAITAIDPCEESDVVTLTIDSTAVSTAWNYGSVSIWAS